MRPPVATDSLFFEGSSIYMPHHTGFLRVSDRVAAPWLFTHHKIEFGPFSPQAQCPQFASGIPGYSIVYRFL